MKLRLRIAKEGLARFLSHLDVQRTLERSMRRAQLPVAYTQGFHPHPRLSFGAALPTGYASDGEYVDVELKEPMTPAACATRLQEALPGGLRVVEAREAPAQGKALMAAVQVAVYWLRLGLAAPAMPADVQEALVAFLDRETVEVEKQGRGGATRQVNIRPLVHRLEIGEDEPGRGGPTAAAVGLPAQTVVVAEVSAGQNSNLRADDLVQGLAQVSPVFTGAHLLLAVRLGLYGRREDGSLVEPWEL